MIAKQDINSPEILKSRGSLSVQINGHAATVPAGVTVAVALALTGNEASRRSVSGQPRGPLCGMGICFECRVTIDQIPDRLGCQTLCQPGMHIDTSRRQTLAPAVE